MDNKTLLSVDELKELMAAMKENDMSRLEIANGASTIKLCRKLAVEKNTVVASPPVAFAQTDAVATIPVTEIVVEDGPKGTIVSSPIVGTFYASASPDKPAYVQVGSKVKKGDTLFIIESMKLMNEVSSELDGTVSSILVQDGQGVEYGQPILCIE